MMNERQELAIQLARDGHSFFLTGGIGTGKTAALIKIVSELRKSRNVSVTASTGLASKQLQGCTASTLHHWSGMRDNRYDNTHLLELLQNDITFRNARKNIQQVSTLIIDEISMISEVVLSQFDFICKALRKSRKPFGGIQVIMCGDFRQLKPVPNQYDPGEYCFKASVWRESMKHVVVLDQVMRQNDLNLVKCINELSSGNISVATEEYMLGIKRALPAEILPVYLYARNYDAEMKNADFFFDIVGEEKLYKATDTGKTNLKKKFKAPRYLVLKVGVKVMLVANLTPELVNGSMGFVTELREDSCIVNFDGLHYNVKPYDFSIYCRQDKVNAATRKQLPLRIAYAITIHKAQGMNLDYVVVDAKYTNKPGHLATAVGRAITKTGLQVINFNKNEVPKQPATVRDFYAEAECSVLMDDLSCCQREEDNDPDDEVIEERPLGEMFVVEPVEDLATSADSDYDGDEDEDLIGVVNTVAEATVLPCNIDVGSFRKIVRDDFIDQETPEQKLLKQCDDMIASDNLLKYLTDLWASFDHLYAPLATKNKKTHKDFSSFVKSTSNYFDSAEFKVKINKMLKLNTVNELEKKFVRLLMKYAKRLLDKFIAFQQDVKNVTGDKVKEGRNESNAKASDASRAGMRYLGGMCFAKAKYNMSLIALNNIHKSSERNNVCTLRNQINMLESHIVPHNVIKETSTMPETLVTIERKQNIRNGLTNISDEAFLFFEALDFELGKQMTFDNFRKYRENLFVKVEETIWQSKKLFNQWSDLFIQTEHKDIVYDLYKKTILPYIHVRCNQFRKDALDVLRHEKTLEIRKEVWKRKSGGQGRGKGKQPKRTLPFSFSGILKAQNKHEYLKSNINNLKKLTKKDLVQILKCYDVDQGSSGKKETFVRRLEEAIQQNDGMKNSSCLDEMLGGAQDQEDSEGSSVCPVCDKLVENDESFWIGCDNSQCNAFVCRSCADLQDDEDYNEAISQPDWQCPLCI